MRLRKRAIVSDDEEEELPVSKKQSTKAKGKGRVVDSDDELKAMMEVDDGRFFLRVLADC